MVGLTQTLLVFFRCIPDHWKIASGEGCDACDCDPVGSTNATCNVYDGQCQCKPGKEKMQKLGGRRNKYKRKHAEAASSF